MADDPVEPDCIAGTMDVVGAAESQVLNIVEPDWVEDALPLMEVLPVRPPPSKLEEDEVDPPIPEPGAALEHPSVVLSPPGSISEAPNGIPVGEAVGSGKLVPTVGEAPVE